MTDAKLTSRMVASGVGWRVSDVLCHAGPADRCFEERHQDTCIAAVLTGTFEYRTRYGSALLSPGALLLGSKGHCFECGHTHGQGDHCIAFHFAPAYLESVAGSVPGARRIDFCAAHLPAHSEILPLIARTQSASWDRDSIAFDEIAVEIAAAVLRLVQDDSTTEPASARDMARIASIIRLIETQANEELTLTGLAQRVELTPYHFLRVFRAVTGVTPHQFILQTRLRNAALRLRRSEDSISSIAFAAGFNDLSTFNRRFRRVMGTTPGAFRARAN